MKENGYKYVDLGLPSCTMWATCNVGASKPEDEGLLFQFGRVDGYKYGDKNQFIANNQTTTSGKTYKRNNILFSSYTVRTSVPDQYRDFRLLDTVKLLPLQRDPDAEGFYIITGIVRQYADGIFRTNLTLNRESGNGIKGNLEAGEK